MNVNKEKKLKALVSLCPSLLSLETCMSFSSVFWSKHVADAWFLSAF